MQSVELQDQEGGPPSFRQQMALLEVGESFARAARLKFASIGKEDLDRVLMGLRNTMQPAAWRVTRDMGRKFRIEAGDFRTRSGDIMAVCVVTRVA